MQPDPNMYLQSLRRELFALTENLDSETASGLHFCFDKIISQLITRDISGSALIHTFEEQVRTLFSDFGIPLNVPKGLNGYDLRLSLLRAIESAATENSVTDLPAFTARASTLDNNLRSLFTRESEQREKTLSQVKPVQSWRLTADRLEKGLPGLSSHWQNSRVANLKRISGIHSKEIYFFDVIHSNGQTEPLVVRCDRNENVTRTSVADEFPLLCELHQRGFNIPQPLAVTSNATLFGQPAVIMQRVVNGKEKQAEEIKDGRLLLSQIAEFLGQLHNTPLTGLGLKDDPDAVDTHKMWLDRIDTVYDWWHENAAEPAPIMNHARNWLVDNIHQVTDRLVLAHGDFSLRNVLISDTDELASVLDWDLAHLGHPAVDLGYIRSSVESLMPWQAFIDRYKTAGGFDIRDEQITFFDVWGLYRNLAINATAQHLFLKGESTDPFFGTTAIYYYPMFLTSLTALLLPHSVNEAEIEKNNAQTQ